MGAPTCVREVQGRCNRTSAFESAPRNPGPIPVGSPLTGVDEIVATLTSRLDSNSRQTSEVESTDWFSVTLPGTVAQVVVDQHYRVVAATRNDLGLPPELLPWQVTVDLDSGTGVARYAITWSTPMRIFTSSGEQAQVTDATGTRLVELYKPVAHSDVVRPLAANMPDGSVVYSKVSTSRIMLTRVDQVWWHRSQLVAWSTMPRPTRPRKRPVSNWAVRFTAGVLPDVRLAVVAILLSGQSIEWTPIE